MTIFSLLRRTFSASSRASRLRGPLRAAVEVLENRQPLAIIHVPAAFPAIQEAIEAAAPGDRVLVAPGTYQEHLDFRGKPIKVTSEAGPELTVIDGTSSGPVVRFVSGEDARSVLSGFTIRNGKARSGAGIQIRNSGPVIRRNHISDNVGCSGMGIEVANGSAVVHGNIIRNNHRNKCLGSEGAGMAVSGVDVQVIDNVVSDNSASAGGGMSLSISGKAVIRGNVIQRNVAAGLSPCSPGGGITMGSLVGGLIEGNVITDNSAGCGGGIYLSVPFAYGAPGPIFVNNTIANNQAAQGSQMYVTGYDGLTKFINNIVFGPAPLFCEESTRRSAIFRGNDVYSPDGLSPYGGSCTDRTGTLGNISGDPLFRDPSSGDYRLTRHSPVIDMGRNGAPGLRQLDQEGEPRIQDGNGDGRAIIDMGADEFRSKRSAEKRQKEPAVKAKPELQET
jgi:serine protease